jgi:tetratricopeptide (TPR) repeat protein
MGFKIDPPENTVNTMGYVLLGEKKIADAITMFKYNLRLYPASANPHDSMADGYEANKQFEPALEESRKACQLGEQNGDPNLPLYRQHLEKLLKETKAK